MKTVKLKLDDENIDRIIMQSDLIRRENQWIPISKQKLSLSILRINCFPLVLSWA